MDIVYTYGYICIVYLWFCGFVVLSACFHSSRHLPQKIPNLRQMIMQTTINHTLHSLEHTDLFPDMW